MPSESTRDGDNPRDFVTALARGLAVIQAFGADSPEMTLSEIARRTSMSAATARRSLITLEQLGYVRRHERRFLLGPKVLTLGASYLESMNLKELAQPHLVELVERFHDAASLTVLDNFEVVYIAHVPSDQRVRHGRWVGSRLPAHATSTGIVLLAHASDEHRRQLLRTALSKCECPTSLFIEPLEIADEHFGFLVIEGDLKYGVVQLELRYLLAAALSRIAMMGEIRRIYLAQRQRERSLQDAALASESTGGSEADEGAQNVRR